MKRAFTLAETLITIGVLGIIAAIILPIINNVQPDKDKTTYKKALYNLQTAVSAAMDSSLYANSSNSAAYWSDPNINDSDFCNALAQQLNTKGAVNCTSSSRTEPNFVTNDGIKYWGLEGKISKNSPKTIRIDRANLSAGDQNTRNKNRVNAGDSNTKYTDGLKIQVQYDGKVFVPPATSSQKYNYENQLIDESFTDLAK